MKTIINPLIISALLFLQSAIVLSQYLKTEVSPKKYNLSFSLMGGESIFADRFILTNDSYSKAQPNLDVSATYYLSDSKALKVDVGYTFTKPYSGSFVGGENFSFSGSKMFLTRISFLVGRFKPGEHFMYNFSIGMGVHYWKQGNQTYNYYHINPADSSLFLRSDVYEFKTEVNLLASLGGSIGYRFVKGFGICAEAEYDMITGYHHNYSPVRAGLFYIF